MIGAVGYVSKNMSNKQNGEISNAIKDYEIQVSSDSHFTNPVTVASGTFDVKMSTIAQPGQSMAKEQVVYFETPQRANYIRLIAKNTGTGNTHHAAAVEIYIYEYVGAQVDIPVEFKYTDENGAPITDSDLPPVDIGFNVPINVLLEKNIESEKENHEVTVEEIQGAFLNGDYQSFIDSMEYNYTIDEDAEITKSGDNWVCPIKRTTATYSLTYRLPNSNDALEVNDIPYGQLFTTDSSAEATEENLVTAAGVTYWTDNDTNEVICSDPYFSLVSSRNMFVTAHTDAMDTTPSTFIDEPMISKAYIDTNTIGWKIELAVKLHNVMKYTSSVQDNHGMVLIDGVEEYGVVIDRNKTASRNSAAVKALLAEGNIQDLTVNKAYDTSDPSKNFTPNNKGRYVHTLATTDESAKTIFNGTKVYSYIKVNGEYYVSNGETLVFPGIV